MIYPKHTYFTALGLIAILLGLLTSDAQANTDWQAESGFQPRVLRVGEQGGYHFTLTGEGDGLMQGMRMQSPEMDFSGMPDVAGLRIDYIGPSRNLQMINRQVSLSLTQQFRVIATKPGDYVMPSFTLTINGTRVTIPEASLKAVERSQDSPRPEDEWVWIEYLLPRESIYVGEALPVQVRLSVREGAHVRLAVPHPEKTGDAFIAENFSEPRQTRIREGGEVIHQVTWEVLITPIRAGGHALGFEQALLMSLPQERNTRQRDRFGGFFGPSLFDQLTRQQQVTAFTLERELRVLALPEAGKPENYTGAIGRFEVEAPVLRGVEIREGEPLELSLRISGTGNFSTFNAPALVTEDDWRDYPEIGTFTAADAIGWRGEQTINYTLIPRSSEITHTPEVAFNFFNPETGNYVKMPLPPQPVTVLPATRRAGSTATPEGAAGEPELLPIAAHHGRWRGSMRPIFTYPAFYAAQLLPLTALLLLTHTRRRKLRLENDPLYARLLQSRETAAALLTDARKAAQAGDSKGFQASAEGALRESFAPLLEGSASGLTLHEMEAILHARNVPDAWVADLRDFFEAGAALRFGGAANAPRSTDESLRKLEEMLDQLRQISPGTHTQ